MLPGVKLTPAENIESSPDVKTIPILGGFVIVAPLVPLMMKTKAAETD